MQKLLVLAIVLLLPMPAWADTNRLKVSCQYRNYVDKEGAHSVKDDFRLTFVIDLDNGTAHMLGKTGSIQVQVHRRRDMDPHVGSSEERVTFIETTPAGDVTTVTVVDDRGNSVHSRNAVIAGEWVPTQYYGTCLRVVERKMVE
jgi:hypothetical protein